ncbi:MAG TPA: 50S ribosomal protein L11 methyltransferase [Thermodesulfobacteriota bacterium]|nr:50S ribosomal protein L11 methyltransferase [Thermodesulfobacteriota bacterium]
MENKWIEIKMEVPFDRTDEVSAYLIGMGSGGVVTGGGAVDTFELSEDKGAKAEIKAYFLPDEAPEKAAEIKGYLEGLGLEFGISVSDIKDDDWAHKWKEFFKPEKITDRIVIKPTWEAYEAKEGDIIIEIDPGMAFGTGTHPTTRGCLRLIEEVVSRGGIETMLDVGTGSGILAIAAAKLGVQRAIAIDLDSAAVKVAEENIILNKVESQVRVAKIKVDIIYVMFNLVVANIIAEELIRLSVPLKGRVMPGGCLILSGIVAEKADMVKEAFKELSLEKELQEGEWVSLLYKRQG